MTARKGFYIAIDGGEGGGKTTIVRRLAEELGSRGVVVQAVREPGGTPLGDALRAVLLDAQFTGGIVTIEELLLMSTQRSALMRTEIQPALDAGKVVLSDRTAASTFAYQLVARGRMDLAPLLSLINQQFVIWPDLLVIFDLEPAVGLARAAKRREGLNRLDEESLEFHTRVRRGFLRFAENPPCPVRIIDASRSEEEVWEEVLRVVLDVIEKRVA